MVKKLIFILSGIITSLVSIVGRVGTVNTCVVEGAVDAAADGAAPPGLLTGTLPPPPAPVLVDPFWAVEFPVV